MVALSSELAEVILADYVLPQDVLRLCKQALEELPLYADGRGVALVLHLIAYPTDLTVELCLVGGEVEAKGPPKEDQARDNISGVLIIGANADDRVVSVDLRRRPVALDECLAHSPHKGLEPTKQRGSVQAALTHARPNVVLALIR